MQQIQVARAERIGGAEKIVKKLIAEVESDIDPGDVWENYWIRIFARFKYQRLVRFSGYNRTIDRFHGICWWDLLRHGHN